MSKQDPAFLDHQAWLGYLQPDGAIRRVFFKTRLDFQGKIHGILCSMPAEPLGFFGNLKLNSGGFFYAQSPSGKEVGHG